jgi:indolepyruvate ferredoxin oxidoreductase alpha subunit
VRISIEQAVRMMGVKWVETIRTYSVATMVAALRRAMTAGEKGLRVIVAAGECQLARQRRVRPAMRKAIADGERVVRTRYGVDDAVCTGDHSCIRLSGCPSLTVKDSRDPLKTDPVAHVNNDCVGCGLCGEVADACRPVPVVLSRPTSCTNAKPWDRWIAGARGAVIGWLQRRGAAAPAAPTPAAGAAE